MSLKHFSILILAGLASSPAFTAERTLSVTDFDRVSVVGEMRVVVSTSTATSVRVSGDSHDLETITASVSGQTLRISSAHFGWGSSAKARGPLTVYVTTPRLRAATLSGSGALVVAHMRAPRVDISLSGSGSLSVETIKAETLEVRIAGSGRAVLSGQAAQASLNAQGNGQLDAGALAVQDIKITAQGASTISANASRSALADALGASSITVGGKPACTVHNTGAGSVTCG